MRVFLSASKPATNFFIRGGTGVPDRSGGFVAECAGEAPVSFSEIFPKVEGERGGVIVGVGVLDLSPSLVDFILLRRDPVAEAGLGVGVTGTSVAIRGPFGSVGGLETVTATSLVTVSATAGRVDFSISPPYPLSTLGLRNLKPITLLALLIPRSFDLVTLVALPSVFKAGVDEDPKLECGPKHFLMAFSPI